MERLLTRAHGVHHAPRVSSGIFELAMTPPVYVRAELEDSAGRRSTA